MLSVEAATVFSVAQGRRTPFARRSLSIFLLGSLRALLTKKKDAARLNHIDKLTSISRPKPRLSSTSLSP